MVTTDLVKDALKGAKAPLSVEEIAAYIATRTDSSCDTADVMDALDDLGQLGEVTQNGNQYSLAQHNRFSEISTSSGGCQNEIESNNKQKEMI